MSLSSSQRGSALLLVSLVLFLVSAAFAGFVWWQLRTTTILRSDEIPMSPTPPSTFPNLLSPVIEIDSHLTPRQDELQTNLIAPLRLYYATQDKQLRQIAIVAIEDETYDAAVTVRVNAGDLGDEEISFLYDMTPWTPSMFDTQPEAAE